MGLVKNVLRKLTHTKALEHSSGKLDTVFFDTVFRVTYVAGLSSSDHNIAYLLYSNTVKLMMILLGCGEVWHACTEASSLDEIAASINTIVIYLISIYRYKNMVNNKDVFKQLATAMKSPNFDISTAERQKLVEIWAQTNERYLKLLLFLGNCTLVTWYVYPLLDELEYNLLVGMRLPFNFKTPTRYPLTYMAVMVAFTYIAYFAMVVNLLTQAYLMHLLCQFTVLADCFENILCDCDAEYEGFFHKKLVMNQNFVDRYTKRLGNLVEQHKLILSHTKIMKATLSGPMLGQLVASGTLICFIGYQATTTITQSIAKFMMSLLYLSCNVVALFIICRWSEELTIQGHRIGEAIYCSGWERGVSTIRGVRSTIMFVIERANKPLVLNAGGMYNLSLTSFTTLVKASYSVLTVLLRFRFK